MNLSTPTLSKKMPWVMWSLGAIFYCYEFCLQVSPSVMANEIMREFNINAAKLGTLSGFYLYAYTLLQIPVGILLDRFGPRRLLTFATLSCALGSLLFASTHLFLIAAVGRFLIGIGSAFAAVSCMYIAASWLPLNRFALTTGLMVTIGMLGAFGGEAPLSLLTHALGWRQTLMLFGFIGIMLSILIWLVIRDKQLAPVTAQQRARQGYFTGLKNILGNRQTWITATYGGLMYLPTPAFAGLWGVPFLIASYHLDKTHAAFYISLIFIGWALGSPLAGWCSDRIGRRRLPMAIGSIGALITLSAILYLPHLPLLLMGALLLAFGLFSSGFLPAFSIVREITPSETGATALGFANTINSLGAAIAQPFIGLMLDLQWQGHLVAGIRYYSSATYHAALTTLPICIGLALIVLLFVRETFCQPTPYP